MIIKSQGHSLILVKSHSDFKVKCFGLYAQVSNSGPQGPPLVRYCRDIFLFLCFWQKESIIDAETENIFISLFISNYSVQRSRPSLFMFVPNNGDVIEVVPGYTTEFYSRNWPKSSDWKNSVSRLCSSGILTLVLSCFSRKRLHCKRRPSVSYF